MICLKCNSTFESYYKNAKFCSRSCAASFNNSSKPKRQKYGTKAQCLNCKKEIYFYPSQTNGKFCSTKCNGEFIAKQTNIKVEQGYVRSRNTLVRYLTEKRSYKCEKCQITEWQSSPISLEVDHIDGNSDNNLPTNLRLLCPNCHSQTETFCSRNKKNSQRSKYNRRYRIRKLSL